MIGGKRIDAGSDALALVERILGNEQMLVGTGGDLRRVRHRHHLHFSGEPSQPRADRIRHRSTDAGIDFVEHERRRGATVGEHDLQRQEETRELAAGGNLHQGSRPRAGVGLHPDLDAVEPLRAWRGHIALDLGRERRALQLQRRELGIDGLVELFGRLHSHSGEFRRRSPEMTIGLCGRRFQLLQSFSTGVDQCDIGGVFGGERSEIIHRRRIFARGSAQREQALFDALELERIEIGGGKRGREMLVRLLQRIDRNIDRLHGRLDQSRRTRRAALQPPHRGRKGGDRRVIAADGILRLAQIGRDLLALHHHRAPVGERGLLAVLRRQRL